MHFWIDKRSQTYGFGRARVAASLSGGGLGFGHPPRRIGGKPMVTPIHRFQPIDSRPPYAHRQNHHYQVNNSNNQSSANHQQHQSHHQHQQQTNHSNYSSQSQTYNHHRTHNVYHHRNHYHTQPVQHRESECPIIQQIDSVELEQGSLGVNSLIQARPTISNGNGVTSSTSDSQALPSHLKCGLWASLALATVFLAVFQGTGLEVLIFCAFSATFFLAACTVSLCRRPQSLHLPPQMETITNDIEQNSPIQQHLPHVTDEIEANRNINTISSLPPPYHIAINLISPDNVNKDIDESPPPSYDKLLI